MTPSDIIIVVVIVLIIGAAAAYIVKAKMSGKRCIGCPDSATCHSGKNTGGTCGGSCHACACGCGGAAPTANSDTADSPTAASEGIVTDTDSGTTDGN